MEGDVLSVVWAGIIVFAVFAYVVMDGFDLGCGLLFWLYPEQEDRDIIMNTVAPVWDGNETWLVLGGGGLFAAFPLAYSVLMPALYAPIIALLLGLVFRGVAFEYRWKTVRARWIWDFAFIGGSLVASLAQGIVLGAIIQGVEVENRGYAGGWWDWLTPFSLTCGVAVVAGYGLLGCTWLVMRTGEELQARARRLSWPFGIATMIFIGIVSLWTPFVEQAYFERWFESTIRLFTVPVPLAVLLIGFLMFRSLRVHHHEYRPFVLTLILFALCFVGLSISLFPYIVPPSITVWDAASPPKSQWFMLVGVIFTMPLIIGYTAYAYWVFRAKVDADTGYH